MLEAIYRLRTEAARLRRLADAAADPEEARDLRARAMASDRQADDLERERRRQSTASREAPPE